MRGWFLKFSRANVGVSIVSSNQLSSTLCLIFTSPNNQPQLELNNPEIDENISVDTTTTFFTVLHEMLWDVFQHLAASSRIRTMPIPKHLQIEFFCQFDLTMTA